MRWNQRPNLKLLLAGPDIDVRPPDHQSLSCIGLAGNGAISAWLSKQHTRKKKRHFHFEAFLF